MGIKYRIPFRRETEWKEAETEGKFAHENFPESRYAKDLLVELGTPVVASRPGEVWRAKFNSKKHFKPEEVEHMSFKKLMELAAQFTNYVCIYHGDGTYAEYIHLNNDVKVKIGDKVKRGRIIGYVGMTGITSEPHLHFNVFRIENRRGISIPFEWEMLV